MVATEFRWLFRARIPDPADVPDPVHDGDTVTLLLDRGLDGSMTCVPLRLRRVFAPELGDPGGQETRQEALWWLQNHQRGNKWPYVVETFRTRTDLHSTTTLARYVAEVTADGDSLNDELIHYVTARGYGKGTGGA